MTRARTTTRRRQTLHHSPQDQQQANSHHPQTGTPDAVARTARSEGLDFQHPQVPHSADADRGERGYRARQHSREPACHEHGNDAVGTQRGVVRRDFAVPPPGALRPIARALLSAAQDVYAERREVRHVTGSAHETTLRMEKRGLRHPVRSGVRSGVLPPATPGRTPSENASSHVEAAPPPPVTNSDCIGDCA